MIDIDIINTDLGSLESGVAFVLRVRGWVD
jgi:hypothetical protein